MKCNDKCKIFVKIEKKKRKRFSFQNTHIDLCTYSWGIKGFDKPLFYGVKLP